MPRMITQYKGINMVSEFEWVVTVFNGTLYACQKIVLKN